MVSFTCENNKLLNEVNKLGKLVGSGIDYTNKKQPLVSVCDRGTGNEQLNDPLDVTVDNKTANIYIADHDVKLSKEYIYVLDTSNPCIHLSNRNLILQRTMISRGTGNQVIDPYSFFIDNSDFILIADCYSSNAISIFNPEFKLVPKIPVSSKPVAVTIDNQNRVIVVCCNVKNCLQIF
ncbi:hypothetical protein LOD99_11373 [Oopsacas minuta]|uniref:Uncharacterized protein n=1 Tax=Oopsacas minuta TaxID=111878 RepID=A0AAV7K3K7_9METZ|nr:hypothetical protein LOD99_11373 [Oopsacas minuta]